MRLALSTPVKILMIAVVMSLGFSLISSSKVHACPTQGGSPAYLPCDQGTALFDYDYNIGQPGQNCYTNPYNNPAEATWLAQTGDPVNDGTITVAYGTTSIPIEFDWLDYQCQRFVSPAGTYYPTDGSDTDNSLTYARTSIDGAQIVSGPGSFSGPIGVILTNNQNLGTRYWHTATGGFTYTAPAGGLTTSETITLRVYYQSINVFHGNTPICVGNGALAGTFVPPSAACGNPYQDYTINVNVQPPPITVESNVYSVDSSGAKYQLVHGALFSSCGPPNNTGNYPQTGGTSSSYYYFTMQQTNGFCLRIANVPPNSSSAPSNSIPGSDGPFARPFDSALSSQNAYPSVQGTSSLPPVCGPYNNSTSLATTCTESTYECQIAGVYNSATDYCGTDNLDRASDTGYDMAYVGVCGPAATTTACPSGISADAPTCTLSSSPANITPGEAFTVNATITNNMKVATMNFGTGLYTASLTTNPLGLALPVPASIPPGSGHHNPWTTSISVPAGESGGNYTTTMTVAWPALDGLPAGSVPCSAAIQVANHPYLKVYGGDVVAGSPFLAGQGACSTQTTAGILSWDDSSKGAATDEGAFATNLVNGFASANNSTATNGQPPPSSLTFANSGGGYGGNSDPGNIACVPDYYTDLSTNPVVTPITPTSTGCSTSVSVKLSCLLPPNLNGSTRTITSPTIVLVNKDFNLTIDENTVFTNPPPGTPISQWPMLYVVDKGGKIFIPPYVTGSSGKVAISQLAGVYIAEPNTSSGGNIRDCAAVDSSGRGTDHDSNPYADCNDSLTINGSFIASDIDFERTDGSNGQASNEANSVSTGSCKSPDPNAAESFCYSPLTWLSNPFGNKPNTDYISAAPPTL